MGYSGPALKKERLEEMGSSSFAIDVLMSLCHCSCTVGRVRL
jgi:hypothetical protein